MSLISWIIKNLEGLEKNKPFKCGGTTTFEFKGGGRKSRIYCRQPTGTEVINYTHTVLDSEKSVVENAKPENLTIAEVQLLCRNKKLIPYAKKIITGWDWYQDPDGKEIKFPNVDMIEKYFPHHLDTISFRMYEVNDSYEKKN